MRMTEPRESQRSAQCVGKRRYFVRMMLRTGRKMVIATRFVAARKERR
jgi:hypothetical protein